MKFDHRNFSFSKCSSCGKSDLQVFYELQNVPVHSVLLMPTKEMATEFPRGDIELAICCSCGFISNIAFDPSSHEYSSNYEETQGFSQTFSRFHQKLATCLVERYDLYGKNIIEIGCGKGEFLTLVCEIGDNRGIGFDPAYVSDHALNQVNPNITFIKDFFSEKYVNSRGDFYCCKMTLEHIQHTADFVNTVRRSVGDHYDSVVFFQVPDVSRILKENAFWDIYYEHCSYFSIGSLGRLFRSCNFDVIDLWKNYNDQYLMIEARPSKSTSNASLPQENDLEKIICAVESFARDHYEKTNAWKQKLNEYQKNKMRVVLWGAGSKGVAFLTTLNVQNEIYYAVDINPYKHGSFMAGTGHEIVSPEFLIKYKPDVVIIMNPIYQDEIQKQLTQMNLSPKLITVDSISAS